MFYIMLVALALSGQGGRHPNPLFMEDVAAAPRRAIFNRLTSHDRAILRAYALRIDKNLEGLAPKERRDTIRRALLTYTITRCDAIVLPLLDGELAFLEGLLPPMVTAVEPTVNVTVDPPQPPVRGWHQVWLRGQPTMVVGTPSASRPGYIDVVDTEQTPDVRMIMRTPPQMSPQATYCTGPNCPR